TGFGDSSDSVMLSVSAPTTPVTASIDVPADPVQPGANVTVNAVVSPMGASGAFGFTLAGSPISGCTYVMAVSGAGDCPLPAPSTPGVYTVAMAFTGYPGYGTGSDSGVLTVEAAPTPTPPPTPTPTPTPTPPVTIPPVSNTPTIINRPTGSVAAR